MLQFIYPHANQIVYSQNPPPFPERAARYGDGIFETFRWHAGFIPFKKHHMLRFTQGIQLLQLQLEVAELWNVVEQELCKYTTKHEAYRVRLQVFRAGSGTYFPESNSAQWWVEFSPIPQHFQHRKLDWVVPLKTPHPGYSLWSALKTISALPYVLGALETQQQQANEGLFLNQQQHWVEGIHGNVWVYNGQNWLTPPLSDGALAGCFRANLLEQFPTLCREQSITHTLINSAQSICLTNVIQGIQPVLSWQNRMLALEPVYELQQKTNTWLTMA